MSVLIALVLFVAGFFLIGDYGLSFFGFLLIIFGVLALFMNRKSKPMGVHPVPVNPYQNPVIVRSAGHAPKYQQIKLRIHDPWDSGKFYEDTMMVMGEVFVWPFKILWRLLRG